MAEAAGVTARVRRGWLRVAAAVLAVALLALPARTLAQDLIVRTGVVDLDAVVRAFYLESETYRAYQARRADAITERGEIEEEIRSLERALVEARRDDGRSLVLRLEQQLFDTRRHLAQFVSVMNDQLQRTYDELKTSDPFIAELNAAIDYVAEAGGYGLIRTTDGLLYWDPDIDLTDEVIAELARRAARR